MQRGKRRRKRRRKRDRPGGPEPGPPAKLLATEDGLELGVGRDLSLGVAPREREPCGPERLQDGVLHVGGSRGHRVDNQPGLPGEVGVAVVRHGPVPPTVLVQVRHLPNHPSVSRHHTHAPRPQSLRCTKNGKHQGIAVVQGTIIGAQSAASTKASRRHRDRSRRGSKAEELEEHDP